MSETFYVPLLDLHLPASYRQLLVDVIAEVTDLTPSRVLEPGHGTLTGRKNGCTGPLCKKALRDWARDYRRVKATLAHTDVRPRRRPPGYEETDAILSEIQTRYEKELLQLPNLQEAVPA